MTLIKNLSEDAAKAALTLALLDEHLKNTVLLDMARSIREKSYEIQSANLIDLQRATADNISPAMLDRLTLNPARVEAMAQGIETIAALPDPIGNERYIGQRPNGLSISKMRVPLGVVCMIYEARPNVTADAGALCFKSGNAVILRGGKEALHTSKVIATILQNVLAQYGLPKALISMVPDPDRALMLELMQQREFIDVIIPAVVKALLTM